MAFPSKYFRQEAVGNVRADVDLVIRQLVDQDAAPAAKRARRASRSAAAPAADGAAAAGDAVQLASFPAHNFILDNSEYFMRQQVRRLGCLLHSAAHTAVQELQLQLCCCLRMQPRAR